MIRKAASNHAIIVYSEEGIVGEVLNNDIYNEFNVLAKRYLGIE